jgi:hypothetical protein
LHKRAQIRFSIGYNFDPALIDGIADVNVLHGGERRVDEVFAALPDSPLSSARPTARIPRLPWSGFVSQVSALRSASIKFNFLMNTAQSVVPEKEPQLRDYLARLEQAGVERLTVGTPALCRLAKSWFPRVHVTLSITYGCKTKRQLTEAEEAGVNAVYLDGVYVNRDFPLLRSLVKASAIECRLYANMSCISQCPVAPAHYGLFARQSNETVNLNDAFFAGCTMVKLRNPVEWLQMPWIRPEDVAVYAEEGVSHFKLADRLASTPALIRIAKAYVRGKSPHNLFLLMERDGAKYWKVLPEVSASKQAPIQVRSRRIPASFIQHFRSGGCTSSDRSCDFCRYVADRSIRVTEQATAAAVPLELSRLVPIQLNVRSSLS